MQRAGYGKAARPVLKRGLPRKGQVCSTYYGERWRKIQEKILTGDKNFKELKALTSATDGNLGAQIKKLNESGYITVEKAFVNNKPQTTCSVTEYGREQFKEYVEMLEELLRHSEKQLREKSGS